MATSQMISPKNITLVYKRSTIISFNKNKNTKTIIRLRLGDFRGIFTSTSSRWIFPDNHLTFGK